MDFQDSKAIYLQIADRICENIMTGVYRDDERIPSVRECAVDLQVNPNTAQRAYEQLQQSELIYLKRGMGYYVSPGAGARIIERRRGEFFNDTLPELLQEMRRLSVTPKEVAEHLEALDKE